MKFRLMFANKQNEHIRIRTCAIDEQANRFILAAIYVIELTGAHEKAARLS